MTAKNSFRGVFAIPVTPFHEDGSLDRDSLRRCLAFTVEAGAHGVVMPVNSSEFFTLSDAERDQVVRLGVEVVDGAVPLVAGITGVSAAHAIERARQAQDVGADALMAMPPQAAVHNDDIDSYYRRLGEAVELPVFIQNNDPPAGVKIRLDLVARLLQEVPTVKYVKQETMPPGPAIGKLLQLAGTACEGVMGGMGGRYLLDEYRRGACGTMPASHFTDVYVGIWDALERSPRGQDGTPLISDEALERWERLLPVLLFESMYGVAAYKEVLCRRGVIATPTMRLRGRARIDGMDRMALDTIMQRLAPALTWRGGAGA